MVYKLGKIQEYHDEGGGVGPSEETYRFKEFEVYSPGGVTAVFYVPGGYRQYGIWQQRVKRMNSRTVRTVIRNLKRHGKPVEWLEHVLDEMVLYRLSAD